MLELIFLVVRAVQFLFAIIVLGLTGHLASYADTPSQINFMVFTSAWTLLVLFYLVLAPKFFQNTATTFVVLGLDVLTMLFWFAGFIALAVFHSNLVDVTDALLTYGCSELNDVCPTTQAAVVFGAFEWGLFIATTTFAALDVFRNRSKPTTTPSAA